MLPRLATPMMQDIVKRCYQTQITNQLSQGATSNYARQSIAHISKIITSFESAQQKTIFSASAGASSTSKAQTSHKWMH